MPKNKKKQILSFERFMVKSDDYSIFKFGGGSLKNEERAVNMMLKYFEGSVTEDSLTENGKYYNLDNMFQIVKVYFAKEYGYSDAQIELKNNYQNTINSYVYNDKLRPVFVHIDELFESVVISFLAAMFKWSKDFDNLDIYGRCFKYVLYLLNDVCIFGEGQAINAVEELLNILNGDIQILQIAEECYWTIVIFSMAHEMAHVYLDNIGKYTEEYSKQEEYDADAIAYHIVLKIIMEKEGIIKDYMYLAPMIYMDFFDLYHYTDRILYKTVFFDSTHPTPTNRKRALFAIVEKNEYEFDTTNGNDLYNDFLDVYETYKEQITFKMHKGKLKSILRIEKREKKRRRENNEEE